MSASESICAPNGLATPSLRASAPSRPSNATHAIRQIAAICTSPRMARKMASMPSMRLLSVHALTSANLARRAAVRSPGRSGIDIAGDSSSTGAAGASAGLIGRTASMSVSSRP